MQNMMMPFALSLLLILLPPSPVHSHLTPAQKLALDGGLLRFLDGKDEMPTQNGDLVWIQAWSILTPQVEWQFFYMSKHDRERITNCFSTSSTERGKTLVSCICTAEQYKALQSAERQNNLEVQVSVLDHRTGLLFYLFPLKDDLIHTGNEDVWLYRYGMDTNGLYVSVFGKKGNVVVHQRLVASFIPEGSPEAGILRAIKFPGTK